MRLEIHPSDVMICFRKNTQPDPSMQPRLFPDSELVGRTPTAENGIRVPESGGSDNIFIRGNLKELSPAELEILAQEMPSDCLPELMTAYACARRRADPQPNSPQYVHREGKKA